MPCYLIFVLIFKQLYNSCSCIYIKQLKHIKDKTFHFIEYNNNTIKVNKDTDILLSIKKYME